MYGYIYKRQNKLNNKIYIGQHKYEKFEIDESYRGSGTYFNRALSKYGEENFTYELIDFAETPEELNQKEQHWISHHNCVRPNGYNLTSGGDCGFHLCEDLKELLSEKSKQLWQDEEYRNKTTSQMSIAHMGKPSSMLGRRFSEEEKVRFRENSMGRKWFNNGKDEVFVYECPEGFIEGRIKKDSFKTSLGKIWMTNGVDSIQSFPEEADKLIQQGYYHGRTVVTQVSEETRKKMRANNKGEGNPMYGKAYVNISKDTVKKRVPKEQLDKYLLIGWHRGWSY